MIKDCQRSSSWEGVCLSHYVPYHWWTADVLWLKDKTCSINNPVYPHGLDAVQHQHMSEFEVTWFIPSSAKIWVEVLQPLLWEHWKLHTSYDWSLGKTPPASKYLKPDVRTMHPDGRKILLKKTFIVKSFDFVGLWFIIFVLFFILMGKKDAILLPTSLQRSWREKVQVNCPYYC